MVAAPPAAAGAGLSSIHLFHFAFKLSLTVSRRIRIVGALLVGARGRRQATPLQKSSHLESKLELAVARSFRPRSDSPGIGGAG
jgi:hypothetical protein